MLTATTHFRATLRPAQGFRPPAVEWRSVEHRLILGKSSTEEPLTRDAIARLLAADEVFWLDLVNPDREDFALLREVFGFHPLAVEDSEHFGQRPKAEEYEGFAFLVLYGAAPDEDDLVEVHCFVGDRFLVTVRNDESPVFAAVRDRARAREERFDHPLPLLHRLTDALVDSFFPLLAQVDEQIDLLEDRALVRAGEDDLREIFALKRRLVALRKIVAPQQDVLMKVTSRMVDLPGMDAERERYFRDVYDHLIRIGDLIDTYRDLLTSSLDVYLSTVSNRLNSVMKQLAVIATVFMPLTFVTGFFGQNFGWMVREVSSWQAFVILGIGIELAMIGLLVLLFRHRRWI